MLLDTRRLAFESTTTISTGTAQTMNPTRIADRDTLQTTDDVSVLCAIEMVMPAEIATYLLISMNVDIQAAVQSALSSYTVSLPLLVGVLMAALGFGFSTVGMDVSAGVSGAIAVFFISLALVGYVVFWLLGTVGR